MADKLSERLDREAARTVQGQLLYGGGPITKQANPTHVVNLLREAAELARRVEGAPSVLASEWIWEDVPTELEGKRVRLVPEPPEVG